MKIFVSVIGDLGLPSLFAKKNFCYQNITINSFENFLKLNFSADCARCYSLKYVCIPADLTEIGFENLYFIANVIKTSLVLCFFSMGSSLLNQSLFHLELIGMSHSFVTYEAQSKHHLFWEEKKKQKHYQTPTNNTRTICQGLCSVHRSGEEKDLCFQVHIPLAKRGWMQATGWIAYTQDMTGVKRRDTLLTGVEQVDEEEKPRGVCRPCFCLSVEWKYRFYP